MKLTVISANNVKQVIELNKDLTFEILIYKIINNEKISYLRLDDYRNPRNGEFEIFQNPLFY